MTENRNRVDALVIAAHPDDAEICCGGTIAKLIREGRKVAVADCTAGELGSRGSRELRAKEARAASEILGIEERVNLGMRDGFVSNDPDYVYRIIEILRHFRPKIVLTHPPFERHPDHEAVCGLVREAMFKSGLIKISTERDGNKQDVYRTNKIFCFMQSYEFHRKPDFYVDISDVHDLKLSAVSAYASQVSVTGRFENEPKTRLSGDGFLESLLARDMYFGRLIGVKYAEAFMSVESLGLSSISRLME